VWNDCLDDDSDELFPLSHWISLLAVTMFELGKYEYRESEKSDGSITIKRVMTKAAAFLNVNELARGRSCWGASGRTENKIDIAPDDDDDDDDDAIVVVVVVDHVTGWRRRNRVFNGSVFKLDCCFYTT
jgi:hypothetical protein